VHLVAEIKEIHNFMLPNYYKLYHMKKIRLFLSVIVVLSSASMVSSQTAEEIISNYLNAIGGVDRISQIASVNMEGIMEVMGSQGSVKTTIVNGKGFRQDVDVSGTQVVMCFTDTMGWQINPMAGIYSAEYLPYNQYISGRDQIFAGGPFVIDYATKGYKLNLTGQEMAGGVNAYRINVMSPENFETSYFFDPETWYLIKLVQKIEMMGQTMEVASNLSNYQTPENGYAMPFTMETDYGGQFFLTAKINKVEINPPVDVSVFVKP
jgi:hypothetical protein